jgi:hypothetical protein
VLLIVREVVIPHFDRTDPHPRPAERLLSACSLMSRTPTTSE